MARHNQHKEDFAAPPTPSGGVQSQEREAVGLTDDERVSREHGPESNGARVTPAPADAKRLPEQAP